MEDKKAMNNINSYDLNKHCCGCSACSNVCPTHAITIQTNHKGFYIPKIDNEKCISCGLCQKVCQIENPPSGSEPIQKYAVISCNEEVRMLSSSGGLFSLLLTDLFGLYRERFHCFGVKFDKNLTAVYADGNCMEQCLDFRGSKYVQSFVGDTFLQISNLLKHGDVVLFVGTGCQCAGLKNYIIAKNISCENLYVVDIICHGTPSAGMWKDYIQCLESRAKQKITFYKFRDKNQGWRGLHPFAVYENGNVVARDKLFLSYGRLFGNLSLNPPCYSCKYANTTRIGDLTMGDYWGIEKSSCDLDDGKGVSLCLINNEKGEALFSKILSKTKTFKIEDDSYLQPQLRYPTHRNILTDAFWHDYLTRGYEYVAQKYTGHGKIYRGMLKLWAKIKIILNLNRTKAKNIKED